MISLFAHGPPEALFFDDSMVDLHDSRCGRHKFFHVFLRISRAQFLYVFLMRFGIEFGSFLAWFRFNCSCFLAIDSFLLFGMVFL